MTKPSTHSDQVLSWEANMLVGRRKVLFLSFRGDIGFKTGRYHPYQSFISCLNHLVLRFDGNNKAIFAC